MTHQVNRYTTRKTFEDAINAKYADGWLLHSWQEIGNGTEFLVIAVFQKAVTITLTTSAVRA